MEKLLFINYVGEEEALDGLLRGTLVVTHSSVLSMMEEERNYSTVVFKRNGKPPKEANEGSTIYSTVEPERTTANTAPSDRNRVDTQKKEIAVTLNVPNETFLEAGARCHGLRLLVLILCVVVLASISSIVYVSVTMNKKNAKLAEQNRQLTSEKSLLEKDKESLSWTFDVILKFNTFPVFAYCTQTTCRPCRDGWIQYREKCYLFYEGSPWETWTGSRTFCQNTAADLVVIESLQEQEFISNHIKIYYDVYHGYWMGLNQTAGKIWRWLDGRNDTLRYWLRENFDTTLPCAMMNPNRNFTVNWDPVKCTMQNKFICESDVLIRSH